MGREGDGVGRGREDEWGGAMCLVGCHVFGGVSGLSGIDVRGGGLYMGRVFLCRWL